MDCAAGVGEWQRESHTDAAIATLRRIRTAWPRASVAERALLGQRWLDAEQDYAEAESELWREWLRAM